MSDNAIKKTINIFTFITLIFLFLPSLYIVGRAVPLYDVIIFFEMFLIFVFYKNNINKIAYFYKFNFFKILILYVLWVIFSSLLLLIYNKYTIFNMFYGCFLLFLYNNFVWYFFPILICPRIISLKKIIKFIIIGIYLTCIYGLLIYLVNGVFHLSFLDPINNIILNRRTLALGNNLVFSRVYSVFEEPGHFGGFLCVNLPIIYKVVLSKYKIVNNKFLNKVLKKTYIPILVLTIILVQSPIWFILFVISTVFYFKNKLKIQNLKNLIVIFIFAIFVTLSCVVIQSVDVSKTFLNRISNTYEAVNSLNKLVYTEPSLATRIISYLIRVKIFTINPIAGVGYKNGEYHAISAITNSNLPLTVELNHNFEQALSTGHFQMSGAIFWNALSDTGIIGTILFYMFLIFNLIMLNKLGRFMPDSIEKDFGIGLKYTILSIMLYSIYDIRSNFVYFWFIFGLTLCFIMHVKYLSAVQQHRRVVINKDENE